MRFRHIFFTICVLFSTTLFAQNRPKLVVVIAIDGLQADHLTTLNNSFEKNGLKRLTTGIAMPNVECNYLPSSTTCDYASLVTGSTPYYHGITGDKRYNLVEDDFVPIYYDGRFAGINSNETLSAKQMCTTTLTDALKLQNPTNKVFAIMLSPENALTFGGHTANGSIWLDDETGKLATTAFYDNGLPTWADKINQTSTIANYLKYEWRPLYELGTYKFKAAHIDNNKVFSTPNENDDLAEQIYRFKHLPYVNTLQKDLAIRALRDEKLGTDAFTDLLAVEFTVRTPHEQGNALNCAEKEDMYLRLDKDIRLLLDAIDLSVGLDETLIVVTGNQRETYSLHQLAQNQISNGEFNAKRSMALLNSYLMAIYGQGRYISGYYARNIYFDKSFISKQKINLNELEQHAAQFMMEFQGVQNAYTSAEIRNANCFAHDELAKIHNSAHKNASGDVIFTLLPGWAEIDANNEIVGVSSLHNTTLPIYIFGCGIAHQTIEKDVEIIDIAPTICSLLDIVEPNVCLGKKLQIK